MTCHGFERAFQHDEVRIGWYPYRALVETQIRTMPGAGPVKGVLAPGEGVGRQSVRNPVGSTPKQRPSVRGADGDAYCWVYSRYRSNTGWVRALDIEHQADPAKKPLTGPAYLDFEVGRTEPGPKKPSGCGRPSPTKPVRRVDVTDTYLRYSPRGTAFHYLHRNDTVRLLLVNGPQGFAFCEVLTTSRSSACKPGAQGWVLASSLKPI